MSNARLKIDGAVEYPLALTFDDLAAFPESAQFTDVSRLHSGRRGDGVTLDAILERARVSATAKYLILHADRDDFHVCVPLEAIKGQGIVVYKLGTEALGVEQGGPIRLIIRDPSACHTGDLDDCANVKYLSRVELTEHRGRDTRPETESAHAALHESQAAQTSKPPVD
jgi:DMSO/TMAO reductase YedYZ molybdopterin-dependent catalytic subunit